MWLCSHGAAWAYADEILSVEAIEGRRPATYDDIKELRAELRAIGRRLDAIEERLPKRRSGGGSSSRSSKS